MADIGKNGYSYTGHSEPFIADVAVAAALLSTNTGLIFDGSQDDAANTITGAIRIENTDKKNQVTFGTLSAASGTGTVLEFGGDDGTQMFRVGDIIEYSHNGDVRDNVRVYEVTDVDKIDGVVTVTVAPAINANIPAGTQLRTSGIKLDLGDGTASRAYVIGELVTEPVSIVP